MCAIDRFITTQEAADALGVGQSYIYHLIAQGRLSATRVGKRVLLVDANSVKALERRPRGRPRKPKIVAGKKGKIAVRRKRK